MSIVCGPSYTTTIRKLYGEIGTVAKYLHYEFGGNFNYPHRPLKSRIRHEYHPGDPSPDILHHLSNANQTVDDPLRNRVSRSETTTEPILYPDHELSEEVTICSERLPISESCNPNKHRT